LVQEEGEENMKKTKPLTAEQRKRYRAAVAHERCEDKKISATLQTARRRQAASAPERDASHAAARMPSTPRPIVSMLTTVRVHAQALVRVLRAWWITRHWRTVADGALHLVPLVGPVDKLGPPITERPSLCGVYVAHPAGATIQPGLVTCWSCAVAHERAELREDEIQSDTP